MTVFRTLSGKMFDLANPKQSDIVLTDITIPLVTMYRYNSGLAEDFSVAQHIISMYVASVTRGEPQGVRQAILLHDLHEAYTGDIVGPVKALLQPQIQDLEDRLDKVIFAYFGHIATRAEMKRCKIYDEAAYHAESKILANVPFTHECELRQLLTTSINNVRTLNDASVYTVLMEALTKEFKNTEVIN